MIVVWAGLIGLVVFAIVRLAGGDRGHAGGSGTPAEPTPREILDRRLARGAIEPDTHAVVADRLAHGAGR